MPIHIFLRSLIHVAQIAFVLFALSITVSAKPLGEPIEIEGITKLKHFFAKLQAREDGIGRVRITHIGDSHIIADFWTGIMRSKLQKRFGAGGRGFVLSGRAWRSFSQKQVYHRTNGDWVKSSLKRGQDDGWFGIGGQYLESDNPLDSTEIYTKEEDNSGRFDTLNIYTLGSPSSGSLACLVDGRVHRVQKSFSPWLKVLKHTVHLNDEAHHVELRPQGDGSIRLFGLDLLRSEGGLIYDAIGLNGAQLKHLLRNEGAALREGLGQLKPDLVILSYGINELFDRDWNADEYAQELELTLSQLRGKLDFECLITGPFAALKGGRTVKDMPRMYALQRAAAERHHCAFWDANLAMGGEIKSWQRRKYARNDGVHLSWRGYLRIAELFEASLMKAYEASRALLQSNRALSVQRMNTVEVDQPLDQTLPNSQLRKVINKKQHISTSVKSVRSRGDGVSSTAH